MAVVYLRTLRERMRLTQEVLAARTGVAQNTISKLERNPHARPVFRTVAALATFFRKDPRDLRFGPDPAEQHRPPRRLKEQVPA